MRRLPSTRPWLAPVLLAAVLYSVRLGSTDLEQWDEIYYASRAFAAANEHAWLDQSGAALGGLWTGSHPPLVVWMMAISCKVLGSNEWGLRAPVAAAGVGCVLLLYALVLAMSGNRRLALVATTLLALSPYFTRYSRMAQLDVPTLLCELGCLLFFWRGLHGRAGNFALAGVAFGLGLLSKIAAVLVCPGIVLAYLSWESVRGSRATAARGWRGLLAFTLLGLLFAAPWYIAITRKLGNAYWQQAFGYHVLSRMARPIEGHTTSLGVLYYPVQALDRLTVLFPAMIMGMIATARGRVQSAGVRRFLLCWFGVPLALLSVTATKCPPYLLILFPQLIVFAAIAVHGLVTGAESARGAARGMVAAFACLVWAQTRPLESAFERSIAALQHRSAPEGADLLAVAACGVLVTLSIGFVDRFARPRAGGAATGSMARAYLAVIALPSLVLSLGWLVVRHDDWIQLRSHLRNTHPSEMVVIGQESDLGRFYLSTMFPRGTVAWRIDASRDGDAAQWAARLRQLAPGTAVIVERSRASVAPAGLVPHFETDRFIVYRAAPPVSAASGARPALENAK